MTYKYYPETIFQFYTTSCIMYAKQKHTKGVAMDILNAQGDHLLFKCFHGGGILQVGRPPQILLEDTTQQCININMQISYPGTLPLYMTNINMLNAYTYTNF